MTSDALIIDGYVDEPACLGVPPYLSPYIRTVAGVLIEAGYRVQYRTIDQVRSAPQDLANLRKIPLTVVIAGQTVPGKYLSGTPATLTELRQLGTLFSGTTALLGGPIAYGISPGGGKAAVSEPIAGYAGSLAGDPATSLFQYLEGFESDRQENYEESSAWSVRGAEIIRQHPCYPHLMLELETAKGCPRSLTGGCSFCTEPFLGSPRYRPINRIEEEVAALAEHGATHFRIGRQPDLLVYGSSGGAFPRPEPEKIEALFHAIRRAAPDLQTLHIDNVNPATIARHQEAATEALEAVVAGHTAGDIAAFGDGDCRSRCDREKQPESLTRRGDGRNWNRQYNRWQKGYKRRSPPASWPELRLRTCRGDRRHLLYEQGIFNHASERGTSGQEGEYQAADAVCGDSSLS